MGRRKKIEPWLRQEGESSPAFAAFNTYLRMGADRSLRKLSVEIGKNVNLINSWSSRWYWQERVREYEDDLAKKARRAAINARKQMVARHIMVASRIQHDMLLAYDSMDKSELKPSDIQRFLKFALDLETVNRALEAEEDTEDTEEV